MLKEFEALIGREMPIDEVSRRLYAVASRLNAPAVGAMLVTCADESERECVEAFRQNFSEYLLPNLKFGERSHFRLANLGGRYETGAIHIAEQHFSTAAAAAGFKLMLAKVNAHVAVERVGERLVFGRMERYSSESVYCGALHALLDGVDLPFVHELRAQLTHDGIDRVATLQDDRKVPAALRSLFVAVTQARLQAERVVQDILQGTPETPTVFVVLPCVTLNRKLADTELVCGAFLMDWREATREVDYRGVGDDPARYRVTTEGGLLLREAEPASGD